MANTKASLKARIESAEAASVATCAPDGALPVIVPADELNGPRARELRREGFEVLTFEQCVGEMV